MHARRLQAALLSVAFVALTALAASAQDTAATSPVIVVFKNDVSFAAYRQAFRSDSRMTAHPLAWAYLDRGVVGAIETLEAAQHFRASRMFSAALRGFAARLTAAQQQALARDPRVSFIEPDGEMHVVQDQATATVPQILPWGIDRIDADLSSTHSGDGTGTVTGVDVYVIDTGIDISNADLNVVSFVNFVDSTNKDCNGHGTHVSGTIAARDNTIDAVGVVPGAPLHAVKVLGCNGSGTTSGVISGIDWVTANAIKPAVANMSLGGTISRSLDTAVLQSVASGVTYAIAAGNDGRNACLSSPARAGYYLGAITTAATDQSDQEASFSNYGQCVNLWAPGVNVPSNLLGGGVVSYSGTSMATPHVAGTAALLLSRIPTLLPWQVEYALTYFSQSTGTFSKDGRAIQLVYAGYF